jgi:hypothetical protein
MPHRTWITWTLPGSHSRRFLFRPLAPTVYILLCLRSCIICRRRPDPLLLLHITLRLINLPLFFPSIPHVATRLSIQSIFQTVYFPPLSSLLYILGGPR